jgi:hypothetical protein
LCLISHRRCRVRYQCDCGHLDLSFWLPVVSYGGFLQKHEDLFRVSSMGYQRCEANTECRHTRVTVGNQGFQRFTDPLLATRAKILTVLVGHMLPDVERRKWENRCAQAIRQARIVTRQVPTARFYVGNLKGVGRVYQQAFIDISRRVCTLRGMCGRRLCRRLL